MQTTMHLTTRRSRPVQLIALCATIGGCGGGGDSALPSANTAPTATITSPAAGATFRAGDSLSFSGSATDAEDGALASGQLTWWADLHHDSHTHPFVQPTPGASGSATVPVRGETADNIFYRSHLRATDSAGATTEVTRDVMPQKSQVTLATQPAGLRLTLDGQPVTAPHGFTGVVGIERDLGAPNQSLNCRNYQLSTWNPGGGSATRTISTPAADTTYTATFTDTGPASNAPSVALSAPVNNSSGRVGTPITLTATASDSVRQRRQHCQRGVPCRHHHDWQRRCQCTVLGELDSVFGGCTHSDCTRHRPLRHCHHERCSNRHHPRRQR